MKRRAVIALAVVFIMLFVGTTYAEASVGIGVGSISVRPVPGIGGIRAPGIGVGGPASGVGVRSNIAVGSISVRPVPGIGGIRAPGIGLG